ncbi:MAG TPA: hypothetical protein VFU37_21875 [Pyrinomonadaceae bacterium]|nr:hypothetical protein [Pyrinomonadaceae bacterium]
MMIQPAEARELCSKSEFKLVESSFSPMVETFPRSGLKSRLDRAIKLYRKTTDLVSLQHSESRKRTTRRKTEMFAEAIGRFEATLDLVENAESVEPAPKVVHNEKLAEETRRLHMDTLRDRADRELESRKSRALSALAVHGEQQAQKSGARHIQSHVGSVNRRQQGRRDTKNR